MFTHWIGQVSLGPFKKPNLMERFIVTDTASIELFFNIFISGIEAFIIPWDQLLYPCVVAVYRLGLELLCNTHLVSRVLLKICTVLIFVDVHKLSLSLQGWRWRLFFIIPIWEYNGPGGSSGKARGYGLDGTGSIPGVGGGGDFTSLLRVQTGPGVHSTSCKMSTGEFFRG